MSAAGDDPTVSLIASLRALGMTVAVAESLTGGALTAELTRPAGASAAVLGGLVVYATEAKQHLAGVDADLLAARGPVDPDVARQLAEGARRRFALGGAPTTWGIGVTGVAGPERQHDVPVGTVFAAFSSAAGTAVERWSLGGDRAEIRQESVRRAVDSLLRRVSG